MKIKYILTTKTLDNETPSEKLRVFLEKCIFILYFTELQVFPFLILNTLFTNFYLQHQYIVD